MTKNSKHTNSEIQEGLIGSYLGGEYIPFNPLEPTTILKSPFYDFELRLRDSPIEDIERAVDIGQQYPINRPSFHTRLNILEDAADTLDIPVYMMITASKLNGTTIKEIKRSIDLGKQGIWKNFKKSYEKRGYIIEEEGLIVNNTLYTDSNENALIVLPTGDLASHLYGFGIGFLSGSPTIYKSPRSLMHIDIVLADTIKQVAENKGYDVRSALSVMTTSHENQGTLKALLDFAPRSHRAVMGNKDTTQLFDAGIPFYLSNVKWVIGPDANLEEIAKIIAIDANRDVTACDTPRIVYIDPKVCPELVERLIKTYEKIVVSDPLDPDADVGLSDSDAIQNFVQQLKWRTSMGYETVLYPNLKTNLDDLLVEQRKGHYVQMHPTLIKAEGPRSVFVREGDLHLNALLIREATLEQAIEEMQYLPESLTVSYFNGKKSKNSDILASIAHNVKAAHVVGHSSKIHDPAGPHERRHLLLELMSKTDLHY